MSGCQYHPEKPMSVLSGGEEMWFRLMGREPQAGRTDLQHRGGGALTLVFPSTRGRVLLQEPRLHDFFWNAKFICSVERVLIFQTSSTKHIFSFQCNKKTSGQAPTPNQLHYRSLVNGKVHHEFKFKYINSAYRRGIRSKRKKAGEWRESFNTK